MNTSNTDREKALAWWMNLTIPENDELVAQYYPATHYAIVSGGQIDHMWQSEIANKYLRDAAPDLYKALSEVSPLLDGLINRTPTGKKRDELCDLNIKVKAALLKAKP